MMLSDADGKTIFRKSCQQLKNGAYGDCICTLQPILDGASIYNWPNSRIAILWGIAGDAYIADGRIDAGIKAYRQSLEIDPLSACIELYADATVAHKLKGEAKYALDRLDCLIEWENNCKTRWQFVAIIVGLLIHPRQIWYKLFGRSRTRRALVRLSKS